MARTNTSDGSDGGNSKRTGRTRRPRLDNPNADPVMIHRDFVERYIGGGVEPAERAYADGLQQWRNLPGAVSSSANVVGQPDPDSDESDSDLDQ